MRYVVVSARFIVQRCRGLRSRCQPRFHLVSTPLRCFGNALLKRFPHFIGYRLHHFSCDIGPSLAAFSATSANWVIAETDAAVKRLLVRASLMASRGERCAAGAGFCSGAALSDFRALNWVCQSVRPNRKAAWLCSAGDCCAFAFSRLAINRSAKALPRFPAACSSSHPPARPSAR